MKTVQKDIKFIPASGSATTIALFDDHGKQLTVTIHNSDLSKLEQALKKESAEITIGKSSKLKIIISNNEVKLVFIPSISKEEVEATFDKKDFLLKLASYY